MIRGRPTRGARSSFGAASFTPKSIATIRAWYRADLGVTLNGSTVSAWADQSGNAYNLTQSTAGQQPLYSASDAAWSNKPSIAFDGVDDVLQLNGEVVPTGSDWSIWIACNIVGGFYAIGQYYATAYAFYNHANPGLDGATGAFSSSLTPASAWTVTYDNTSKVASEFQKTTAKGTQTVTTLWSGAGSHFHVGAANNGAAPVQMTVVEVAVFSSKLSAAQISQLATYASRYGL